METIINNGLYRVQGLGSHCRMLQNEQQAHWQAARRPASPTSSVPAIPEQICEARSNKNSPWKAAKTMGFDVCIQFQA